jgi:2-keto-4-pentenoate hydratase
MSDDQARALAHELMSAHQTGTIVASLPSTRPGFDLDTAYAVEAILKAMRQATGHSTIGRKIGYANKAMWRALKLETLVWAHMYDDTVHYSENNSAAIHISHPRSLKVEPEIVFGLKQPLAAEAIDATAALAATDWLAIGFEIIDCPYPSWKFQPSDFVASFGLHAALVIGERRPVRAADIPALVEDLQRFKVRVSRQGEFVEEGSGRNCLKSPAFCLAELGSAILRRFPDAPLRAGEIVSSGTLTPGHLTTQGDLWTVEVEGLSLSLPPLTLQLT